MGSWGKGAGISWENTGQLGELHDVCIRYNRIIGNTLITYPGEASGGGIFLYKSLHTENLLIQNNLVAENSVTGFGGGLCCDESNISLINNTFINNSATVNGHSLSLIWGGRIILFNNLLWGKTEDTKKDIFIDLSEPPEVHAHYNLLSEFFSQRVPVTASMNTYMEPSFEEGTCRLAEGCPAIGRGADSIEVNGVWYYAPDLDIFGLPRIHGADEHSDIGAAESSYSPVTYSTADLAGIRYPDHRLDPTFHPDTLLYAVAPLDTLPVYDLLAESVDALASTDIQEASDIHSNDREERLVEISVTSSDGTTDKTYHVDVNSISTVNTLSSLEVEGCELDVPFDPEVLDYTCPGSRGVIGSSNRHCDRISHPGGSYCLPCSICG
jgi:hypothetical protein